MSLSAKSSHQSTRRIFFMNSTYYTLLERRNKTFLGSAGQSESKCQKLAPIDKKKIFHELDVQHV